MIGVLMTFFLKFHILLASNNKTTIENLDKKGKNFKSIYDIGSTHNWSQIFGSNKFLWPFPIFLTDGKPIGDGIYWPSNQKDDDAFSSNHNKSEAGSAEKRVLSPSSKGITSPQGTNLGNQQPGYSG
jgi:hypothetical protein